MFSNYKKVMLWDFETLGLNYYLDKIIEFGYILLDGDDIIERGDVLINWGLDVPEIITELTHITKEMIDEEGITPQEFYNLLIKLLNSNELIIAHNAPFDISMMHNFLVSFGHPNGIEEFDVNYFDSLSLVADFIEKGKNPRKPRKNSKDYENKMIIYEDKKSKVQTHKVESCCRYYGIKLENAHRALADIVAVHEILKAFKKDKPDVDLEGYVNKFGYKMKWKIDEKAYFPKRVRLYSQGDKGERYILDSEEEELF